MPRAITSLANHSVRRAVVFHRGSVPDATQQLPWVNPQEIWETIAPRSVPPAALVSPNTIPSSWPPMAPPSIPASEFPIVPKSYCLSKRRDIVRTTKMIDLACGSRRSSDENRAGASARWLSRSADLTDYKPVQSLQLHRISEVLAKDSRAMLQ
jgi:hypothetical protein